MYRHKSILRPFVAFAPLFLVASGLSNTLIYRIASEYTTGGRNTYVIAANFAADPPNPSGLNWG